MGVPQSGTLACSKAQWQMVESRKDATAGKGKHYALTLVEERPLAQVTAAEKAELVGIAWRLAEELGLGNRFRISVNGPGLVRRDTLHIHIVFVNEGVEHVNLTDP